ncbi:hypothetical protein XcvCFBP7113P_05625 [Xanthomonas citri pv. vignicola]|nr:hypothetical protein XcvCFBP7113P_05625 [Xanthomonas citri pv. vignicola]
MTSDFRIGEQEEGYKELVEHQKLFSAACSVALNGSTRTRATELEVENQQDWDDIGQSGTGVQDEDGHAVALLDQCDSPLVKSKIAQCYAIYKSMCGEEGLDALPPRQPLSH